MNEELISFKTAKLAKECGCELKGDYLYIGDRDIDLIPNIGTISEIYWHALTQSLLQKWLREKHKIHIDISPFYYKGDFISWNLRIHNTYYKDKYNTYEEALEYGLKECLNKLPKP